MGNTPEKDWDNEPGTPVIIKTGSNQLPSGDVEIIINSPNMAFTPFVPEPGGQVWTSQSILTGRIHKLSIVKNPDEKPHDEKQPFPHQLASIRIEYGPTHSIIVRESGNIAVQDVVLVIESMGSRFDIQTEWNRATAMFPPPTRVVFTRGNETVEYPLEGVRPELTIEFPKPTGG